MKDNFIKWFGENVGRLKWVLLLQVITLAILAVNEPKLLGVWFQKINMVSLGGLMGFAFDREVFRYARPHDVAQSHGEDSPAFFAACFRRAAVIAAAMLATALVV